MESHGFAESVTSVRQRKFFLSALWWEMHLPVVAVGVVSLVLYFAIKQWMAILIDGPKGMMIGKLFDGAIGISSIMAGFASTLTGIMFSIRGSARIKKLEETGHFNVLKGYLLDAVDLNITLALLSIVANVVIVRQELMAPYLFVVIVPIFAAALLSIMRVVKLMVKLL